MPKSPSVWDGPPRLHEATRRGRNRIVDPRTSPSRRPGSVGPRVARASVTRELPGVIEHKPGRGSLATACQHAQLIRVRSGVEVATDDHGIVTAGHLLDEGSELVDLRLTHSAGIQWAVEHEDKQLDATAGTVNVREQGCADISRCASSKSPATPSLTIKAGRCPRSSLGFVHPSRSVGRQKRCESRFLLSFGLDIAFCLR
jgi:hypothetical protein